MNKLFHGVINIIGIFFFAIGLSLFIPTIVHAEELTGKLIIKGSMQPNAYIEAELINSNNTGELSYQWFFDFGALGISYERYHQKKYQLWDSDFGHYICCVVKSSKQTGQIQSSSFYLTTGGVFDSPGTGSSNTPTVQGQSAPTGLRATPGNGNVTLNWNASAGASTYYIYRYERSENNIYLLGSTSALGFTVKNLTNGVSYEFIVRAKGDAGWSEWNGSQAVSATPNTVFAINNHPVNCSVNEGENAAFTVGASGSGLTYQWQKSTDGGNSWSNSTADGNQTATLTMSVKYSDNNTKVRCIVKDSSNATVTSNAATLTISKVYPYFTSNTSDVTVIVGDAARFIVSVYGIGAKYQWQQSTDGGSNWVNSTATGATTANLSMTAVSGDNNKKFRCVVTVNNGEKITSNAATLHVNLLTTPVLTEVSKTSNGAMVKWNAVNGAAKYRVFYKEGNGSWTALGDTTSTSMEMTGLKGGVKYTFTVRCTSSDGKLFTSNYDTVGKSITNLLATPVLTSVTATADIIQVNWNAVSGAAKYRVFYKEGNGSWIAFGDTIFTSIELTGLNAGSKYTFTVRCISSDGKTYTSNYDTVGKSITYMLSTPVLTGVSNKSDGVEVKWNAVSGAAKYRVFYRIGNGAWTQVSGDVEGTSKVVTGLTQGTTYIFTVRCVSADGKNYTSTYDGVGKSIAYGLNLATPVISKISNVSTGVQVTWNAVSGAAKYRVFYRTSGGSWIAATDTTATNATVTGLTSGTAYSFVVRCISADGKSYTSPYDTSKSKGITFISQPVLTSVSNTSSGVEVKWNAVNGAAKYRVFYRIGNGAWTQAKDVTGTSAVISGLTKGTTYIFTVRCISADGNNYTSSYDGVGKSIKVQ